MVVRTVEEAGASSFAPLRAALERQLAWAQEFARVSDFESADEALRDAGSLAAELRVDAAEAVP
jgi:hypothetical protein